MAEPVYIPLPEAGWPLIELGFGLVEVAEGRQPVERVDGTKDERPALIFGRNGSGKVGEALQGDRAMQAGEPLAVITFANVESLDVVMDKLRILRERITLGVALGDKEPCPRGEVSKPEPSCTNRHQCWEPCGRLGNAPGATVGAGASNYDTRQFSNLSNQAHGYGVALGAKQQENDRG